jgi:hypothetical protein
VVADDDSFAADAGDGHLLSIAGRDAEQAQELLEDLRTGTGLVLLDHVAYLVQHHQLEPALHLRNSQVLVHAVTACQ